MLKRLLASTAALALLALPLRAQTAAAGGGGDQVTLTGTVIDVNCYSTHQLTGAQHKNCATACANKGVSLAILTNDGTIYMPVSSKPAELASHVVRRGQGEGDRYAPDGERPSHHRDRYGRSRDLSSCVTRWALRS